jgi:hypothetical protein
MIQPVTERVARDGSIDAKTTRQVLDEVFAQAFVVVSDEVPTEFVHDAVLRRGSRNLSSTSLHFFHFQRPIG